MVDEDAGFAIQARPFVWISLFKQRTRGETVADVVALY